MSNPAATARVESGPERSAPSSRRFKAQIGRFKAPRLLAVIDGLTRWIEREYEQKLRERPSKHVYPSTLPPAINAEIDQLRDSAVIRDRILE